MAMSECPSCGKKYSDRMAACPFCKAALSPRGKAVQDPPAVKRCPYCSEEILETAVKCKHCQTSLEEGPAREKVSLETTIPYLPFLGSLLIIVGLGVLIYFYGVYDTTVEVPKSEFLGMEIGGQRVHNLGLLQNRNNGIIFGFGALFAGLVLFVLSKVSSRSSNIGSVPRSPGVPPTSSKITRAIFYVVLGIFLFLLVTRLLPALHLF